MTEEGRIPGRSVRIDDDLWAEGLEAVKWRGDPSLSWVLRRALTQYVRATKKRQQEEGYDPTGIRPGQPT